MHTAKAPNAPPEEYLSSLVNRRHLLNISRDIIRAAMEILTPAQLAERLHVKPTWVYEQTRKRTHIRNADSFPYIKMGLYLRFDWNDVLAWLERQKRGGCSKILASSSMKGPLGAAYTGVKQPQEQRSRSIRRK